jgi:hypothetical protein
VSAALVSRGTDPLLWWDSAEPVLWFDSSETADIADPIDPTEAKEPTLANDATDAALPIERTEFWEAIERIEFSDQSDHTPSSVAALAEAPGAFGSTLAEWTGPGDTEQRWRGRLATVAPFARGHGVGDAAIDCVVASAKVVASDLVSGLELGHDVGGDPATLVDLDALGSRPGPDLGRRCQAAGSCPRPRPAPRPADARGPTGTTSRSDVSGEGIAKLLRVPLAEIDLVQHAVQTERQGFVGRTPIEVVYKGYLDFLRHGRSFRVPAVIPDYGKPT